MAARATEVAPAAVRAAAGQGRLALALGVLAAGAMGWAAVQVARVDSPIGAPIGPDRLIAAIDTDPAPAPGDAARARAVLHDRPIDGRAYRVLAIDEANASSSPRLLHTAAARWPRDRLAQGLLAERALADGDIERALDHVDALLRVAPSARTEVLGLLVPHIGDPALQAAFIERLAQDPPWRAAFTTALLAPAVPPQDADAALVALAARSPLGEAEIQARVRLLESAGDTVQARRVWLDAQAVDPAERSHAVFDGGFELEPTRGGFGWQWQAPAGVSIERDASQPFEGQSSLRVQFDGRSVRFDGPRQSLALAPGRYRFTAATDDGTDSLRPFVWSLQCAGQGGASLVQAAAPRGAGWQRTQATFEVPPACPGQTLRLRPTGRTLAERRLRGALRIDAVRIIPMQ
jgi:hypothetical protein